MDLRQLYEEIILDHNRNPRNYPRRPEGANRSAHGYNPLCGDDFHVHLTVEDGVVKDIGFEGHGCAISTASASLMTEAVKGGDEAHAHELFARVRRLLTSAESTSDDLGKLSVLGGVREYPMRVKCATLAWHTLEAALRNVATVTTE
jgi:nitrogen fixation NifU-like protein